MRTSAATAAAFTSIYHYHYHHHQYQLESTGYSTLPSPTKLIRRTHTQRDAQRHNTVARYAAAKVTTTSTTTTPLSLPLSTLHTSTSPKNETHQFYGKHTNYGRPPAMLTDGHSVLPLSCRSSFSFFLPPNLRGRLADCHQTLPHVRRWPRFIKFRQKFGWPIPPKFGGPKSPNFRVILHNFATLLRISGMQQDIVNRKMALQTTDIPAQTNLIWCSLVQKGLKIGPEFWPTQRAAIRLGIATHLVISILRHYLQSRVHTIGAHIWHAGFVQTIFDTIWISFSNTEFLPIPWPLHYFSSTYNNTQQNTLMRKISKQYCKRVAKLTDTKLHQLVSYIDCRGSTASNNDA